MSENTFCYVKRLVLWVHT